MTDNRTTELREKLDELGIEHADASYKLHTPITAWTVDGATFCYVEGFESTDLHIDNATPDQAIAAMLSERHPYEQRITGDGSDWGEIMTDAFDSLMSSASESCTPDEMRALESHIAATLGSEREKRLEKLVRIYGEIANYFCERFACCDSEFANCKYCIGLPQGGQCELGWCNDESKALGIEQPDYGGGKCEPVNLQELYDRIGELENELAELGNGTLTAEQVRKAVNGHGNIMDNRLYCDWQAIADELNELRSGTCELEPLSALDVTLNMLGQTEWGACSECGCAVPMDARFCNKCGKAVKR